MEEPMPTKLLQEGLGRLLADVDWIEACFANAVDVSDLDPRTIFHREHLVGRVFMVRQWSFDVGEFWLFLKVGAEGKRGEVVRRTTSTVTNTTRRCTHRNLSQFMISFL